MATNDSTSLESVPPANRLGRSGLLVFAVSLATAGAFGGVAYLMRDQSASKDVLMPLMYIIGGVGLSWAVVLGVRAVANRETLLFPFLIALPIFWGLSIPLLQTWPEVNRGEDDKWYFLHVGLFPLIIPLGVFALSVAAPPLFWFWRKTQRADEAERPKLRRRTRKIVLTIATAVFVLLLPFGFYLFAGTMAHDRQWTASVIEVMPRWIGNADYALLRAVPGKYSDRMAEVLLQRGLLTPSKVQDEIEARVNGVGGTDPSEAFLSLSRQSPSDARALARKLMSTLTGSKNDTIAAYFAEQSSAPELKMFLEPERFPALNGDTKSGLMAGLNRRKDKQVFVADCEALMDADTLSAGFAGIMLAGAADDTVLLRTYLKMIDRNDPNVERFTAILQSESRDSVLAQAIQKTEPPKRVSVLLGMLKRGVSLSSGRRLRNQPKSMFALGRVLDSADEMERVSAALIILFDGDEMPAGTAMKYGLIRGSANSVKLTPVQLRIAGDKENRALVERARALHLTMPRLNPDATP